MVFLTGKPKFFFHDLSHMIFLASKLPLLGISDIFRNVSSHGSLYQIPPTSKLRNDLLLLSTHARIGSTQHGPSAVVDPEPGSRASWRRPQLARSQKNFVITL